MKEKIKTALKNQGITAYKMCKETNTPRCAFSLYINKQQDSKYLLTWIKYLKIKL